jgi:hypothetical protein
MDFRVAALRRHVEQTHCVHMLQCGAFRFTRKENFGFARKKLPSAIAVRRTQDYWPLPVR